MQVLADLETVDDDCKENDINVVKTSDPKLWESLGIEDSPVLVYYENDVPFVYPHQGSALADEQAVLKWLINQRNTAAIEEVTNAMLDDIIDDHDYVAVLFTGIHGFFYEFFMNFEFTCQSDFFLIFDEFFSSIINFFEVFSSKQPFTNFSS